MHCTAMERASLVHQVASTYDITWIQANVVRCFEKVLRNYAVSNREVKGVATYSNILLTLIGMRKDTFYPLSFCDLSAEFLPKNFQTFLKVKIDIN